MIPSVPPIVSVVVPAYNAAAYIQRALDSVLSQSFESFEVIVVDDASSDHTRELVREYIQRDCRVQLICNTDNSGPAYSRNLAIKRARGRWVAILDADDWYSFDRLQVLLQEAERSQAQFVGDNLYRIEEGKETPYGKLFSGSVNGLELTLEEYLKNSPPGEPNTFGLLKPLISREFIQANNLAYDSRIRLGEDFFFYLEILAAGAKALVLPEAYYYYVSRPGSLTRTRSLADVQRMLIGLERILNSPHITRNAKVSKLLQKRYRYVQFVQVPVFQVLTLIRSGKFIEATTTFYRHPWIVPALVKRALGKLRPWRSNAKA